MPKISEARRAERRAEVLAAASICFASKGFHATSMDDIVAECGISLGGIYRYFASKDEIVEAIAQQRHSIEIDLLRDALDHPEPVEALSGAASALAELLGDPGEIERRRLVVHLWGEALRSDAVHRTVLEGVNGPVRLLDDYLSRQAELSPAATSDSTARVLVSIVLGLIAQQSWDPTLDTAEYAAAAASLIKRGLNP